MQIYESEFVDKEDFDEANLEFGKRREEYFSQSAASSISYFCLILNYFPALR